MDLLSKHGKEIRMKTSIISIDGKDVEDVDSFAYLGSIVNKTG